MPLVEVIGKNNTPFPNSPPIPNYFVRNLVNEFICYDFIKSCQSLPFSFQQHSCCRALSNVENRSLNLLLKEHG